jgi:CHASE2 domain-containing sensor protein/serine phosphatase RsbU (regulator of sigma subunit)
MTGLKSTSDPAPGMIRLQRVRLAGLAAALLTAALLALFAGRLFAEPLFDRYQRWQPRQIADTSVHIVRIDPESLKALGPWPWPRSYLALLTDRIREAGAIAIGFDIVFAEPDPATDPKRTADVFAGLSPEAAAELAAIPSLDARFGRALGKAHSVVARTGVLPGAVEAQGRTPAEARALYVEAQFAAPLPASVIDFPLAIGNVPDIEDSARGQGLINGNPDDDGVTRRLVMAANVGGNPTPGISVDLVRVAMRATTITPEPGALRLGAHRIPVEASGEARLHFGTLPDGAETSAVNMIRKPLRADSLKGRIVLVGPAATGLGDVRVTPLGRPEFGVRLHAQAIDTILKGDWLVRPGWALAAEWALGGLLAALAIIVLPLARWRALWPALAVVLVFAISLIAFAQARLLLDPLRPLLLGGTTALAVVAALFAETGRVARQLRDARLAADGEMKAAREIQQAMLPDRATLAALHPGLDLDAVLEPAQAIGGDLYDAFALPDGRVVFLVGDVTGKGPSAALFMAVSKALAHSLLRRGGVPLNRIIEALNDELVESSASVAEVTLLCGIIDPASGRVDLVNAGHENPLRRLADGAISDVPMDGGLPLCTAAGFPYPLESVDLAPGDALIIITDGVREAQNAAGGFFGSDRTRSVLAGLPVAAPAMAATAALVGAVRAFEAGNPASDDLTVMVVARRPI